MTAANTQAAEGAEKKEKGPSPFLRGVAKGEGGYAPTVALWSHADGSKTHGHGYIGDHQGVTIFFNHDKESGKRSISVKKYVEGADGAEGKWELLGFGNAVNSNKDGKPVYFDTVLFNIGDKTYGARVTAACDESLRQKIGFTSAQVQRPAKEGEAEAETAAEGASAPRPRG